MMKWSEQAREKRERERERGRKPSYKMALLLKCMLINGCSINQWNIIKFKQCDFFSHLPKLDSKHRSLDGPKVTPIPMVQRTLPSFPGGCHRAYSHSCITLVCCEAQEAIERCTVEMLTLISFDIFEV